MPKFKFHGTATVSGTWFYITAPDVKAAQRRAEDGDFDEADFGNGEITDAEIKVGTPEPCD